MVAPLIEVDRVLPLIKQDWRDPKQIYLRASRLVSNAATNIAKSCNQIVEHVDGFRNLTQTMREQKW
jgi:hypothetical protein